MLQVPEYWGIDSEGLGASLDVRTDDLHSIQVCSSAGEQTGHAFRSKDEFLAWYNGLTSVQRPRRFYAFTLSYEFGSLAAWELLGASNAKGKFPWQNWLEEPKNLFYIQPGRKKFPVYDTRCLFGTLAKDKQQPSSLRSLGDYLSQFYNVDAHKLPTPLGKEFGLRAPTEAEWPEFAKYGVRDSYICALAGKWINDVVVEGWLNGTVPLESLFSWGTVAKDYLALPKVGHVRYRDKNGTAVVGYDSEWFYRIQNEACTAGRSDAFITGLCGNLFYNDVSSLYPISAIHTQCFLIRNIREWDEDKARLLGPITSERFYEVTGSPYGWIQGDFSTQDDLWGLPIRRRDQNWFVSGENFRSFLYHVLELEAANAQATHISHVLLPVFVRAPSSDPIMLADPDFLAKSNERKAEERHIESMRRYEALTTTKLEGQYRSAVEKECIKATVNSGTGILGQSRHGIVETTNPLAYSTLLGESHLIMSRIYHKYDSPKHRIAYGDTDSFFWDEPVEGTIEFLEPYPTLPYQIDRPLPLTIGVKGTSRPEGCAIFRGKLYYQSETSQAFSGWKPEPRSFREIVEGRLQECEVIRQTTRKWRTRDRSVTHLRVGRWWLRKERWDLTKIKRIFRADDKRCRVSRDSYQLFLDGQSQPSRAWTLEESYSRPYEREEA
jgi:hypothetical protein